MKNFSSFVHTILLDKDLLVKYKKILSGVSYRALETVVNSFVTTTHYEDGIPKIILSGKKYSKERKLHVNPVRLAISLLVTTGNITRHQCFHKIKKTRPYAYIIVEGSLLDKIVTEARKEKAFKIALRKAKKERKEKALKAAEEERASHSYFPSSISNYSKTAVGPSDPCFCNKELTDKQKYRKSLALKWKDWQPKLEDEKELYEVLSEFKLKHHQKAQIINEFNKDTVYLAISRVKSYTEKIENYGAFIYNACKKAHKFPKNHKPKHIRLPEQVKKQKPSEKLMRRINPFLISNKYNGLSEKTLYFLEKKYTLNCIIEVLNFFKEKDNIVNANAFVTCYCEKAAKIHNEFYVPGFKKKAISEKDRQLWLNNKEKKAKQLLKWKAFSENEEHKKQKILDKRLALETHRRYQAEEQTYKNICKTSELYANL